MSKKVYLAGPQVFTPMGREFVYEKIAPAVENAGMDYIFPLELGNEEKVKELSEKDLGLERASEYNKWSKETGRSNLEAINNSDIVLANLDGADVDSGTAAEIGYAMANGKIVIGYRTDVRRSGENESVAVNLQVEQVIRESGGKIICPNYAGRNDFDDSKEFYKGEEEMLEKIETVLNSVR